MDASDAMMAEAERDRAGARSINPEVCIRELIELWTTERLGAMMRHYESGASSVKALDRVTDCCLAIDTLAHALVAERTSQFPMGHVKRIEERARLFELATQDVQSGADFRASAPLRAAFLRLLANDTRDRLSGAVAMDYPLPVLP